MNLLIDPLFRVERKNGPRKISLPALFSALGTDEVESLPGLQRHQEDAFFIFLCQLAASVLVREDKADPAQDEAFWCDGIRRLTGRDESHRALLQRAVRFLAAKKLACDWRDLARLLLIRDEDKREAQHMKIATDYYRSQPQNEEGLRRHARARPHKTLFILLGPGSTVSHDALRLLARHGTLMAAVGEGGVKLYTAPPMGQHHSDIARAHAYLWADDKARLEVARRMYAFRFGRILPHRDIAVLRGIEGGRMKKSYQILAEEHGVPWQGRRYDRQNPTAADIPNQAINHAATFTEAAADIAVAAVGALPPLGFIHEESSNAFTLDIADLYRTEVSLPLAFSVARKAMDNPRILLEREIRKEAARQFRKQKLIPEMIDRIKELLHVDDRGGDP